MARVIKKFKLTILSHPSHTGLFSYFFAIAVRMSASFQGPAQLQLQRSAVDQGLKSSQITREYTYFRKNRVQIRKSRGEAFAPLPEGTRVHETRVHETITEVLI